MFSKKNLVFTAFLLAAMMLVAACGGSDNSLERIQKAGKIRVAVDVTYPPMEYEGTDGKPEGFDIDFANELAKRLGVQAEFVPTDWGGILTGLVAKRHDVIISSMNITEDRLKEANFVEYVRMSQVFVSKPGTSVTKAEDLAGKIVAVQADTTSAEYVEELQAQGVAVKELKQYGGATEAFAAVKAGHAEVIVIDEPVGKFYVKQDPGTFVITGNAIDPEPVGIAIHKNDKKLAAAIQKAVDEMKADGTLRRISEQWFGGELGQ